MPTAHRLMDGKAQFNLRLRALPFPATIFLLGTATSLGIWQLLRHSQYVESTEEFDGDANALAFQVKHRELLNVPIKNKLYIVSPSTCLRDALSSNWGEGVCRGLMGGTRYSKGARDTAWTHICMHVIMCDQI